jgi:hypothetical protein
LKEGKRPKVFCSGFRCGDRLALKLHKKTALIRGIDQRGFFCRHGLPFPPAGIPRIS